MPARFWPRLNDHEPVETFLIEIGLNVFCTRTGAPRATRAWCRSDGGEVSDAASQPLPALRSAPGSFQPGCTCARVEVHARVEVVGDRRAVLDLERRVGDDRLRGAVGVGELEPREQARRDRHRRARAPEPSTCAPTAWSLLERGGDGQRVGADRRHRARLEAAAAVVGVDVDGVADGVAGDAVERDGRRAVGDRREQRAAAGPGCC